MSEKVTMMNLESRRTQEIGGTRGADSNEVDLSQIPTEVLLAEIQSRFRALKEELERVNEARDQVFSAPDYDIPDLLSQAAGAGVAQQVESDELNDETMPLAKVSRLKAVVRLGRIFARAALQPSHLSNGRVNRNALAREFNMPRNTMRPYLDAGLELEEHGCLYENGEPTVEEMHIVEAAMEPERARKRGPN